MHVTAHKNTNLEYALAYAAIGWPVFPIHTVDAKGNCSCGNTCKPNNRGKHPATPHGFKSATTNADVIRNWWQLQNYNIGVWCRYFSVLDVDPRNGGDETLNDLIAKHDMPDTVMAITGGGGNHYLFVVPEGKKLKSGLRGIDIKDAGGYIVVEPSAHHSGNHYCWDSESDPLNGAKIAVAPAWLLEDKVKTEQENLPTSNVLPIDPETVTELRQAFGYIDMDPYDTWLKVGQALHSEHNGQQGLGLWLEASRQSQHFDPSECRQKWKSFTSGKGLTIRSIFKMAQDAGWVNPNSKRIIDNSPVEQSIKANAPGVVKRRKLAVNPIYQPTLEPIPGALGEVYDWIMATSSKPQPLFAMQTALAFGSIIAGRRYVGQYQNRKQVNFTSLYFLNIGATGSGKEHAKTAIEDLLEACELDKLIGPGKLASEAGILSTLMRKPNCLSVIDEFGKMLSASKAKGNYLASDVVKYLMEVWGRCHGTLRYTGYSTFGLNDKQLEEIENRIVRNPGLTLLSMTTPETFFTAAGSAEIADGFLNRFLIAHSDTGRQLSDDQHNDAEVPDYIVDWAKSVYERATKINPLALVNDSHDAKPDLIKVHYSAEAWKAFKDFEAQCNIRMNALDEVGLADAYSRTREIAMRISVIIAISCDSPTIEKSHAEWAINYVDELQQCNVSHLAGKLADTPFQHLKNAVLETIRKSGERGATHREIVKACRTYKSADPKAQDTAIMALIRDQDIELREMKMRSGQKRSAWVAIDPDVDSVRDEIAEEDGSKVADES